MLFVIAIFALAIGVAAHPAAAHANDTCVMKVHFIDVGQGDATFIEPPDGETMLVDAGIANNAGSVVSYITSLGYSSIDYVVGSHPDSDHIGGMPAVFAAFDIAHVYTPNTTSSTLANSRVVNSASRSDAIARGLGACGVCNP